MSVFAKTLLITVGPGSFGDTVLNCVLATDNGEIRIFLARREKQDELAKRTKGLIEGVLPIIISEHSYCAYGGVMQSKRIRKS